MDSKDDFSPDVLGENLGNQVEQGKAVNGQDHARPASSSPAVGYSGKLATFGLESVPISSQDSRPAVRDMRNKASFHDKSNPGASSRSFVDGGYSKSPYSTTGKVVVDVKASTPLKKVNTSGQFVGLAEMIGPVDLNKNMEFWRQDRWNGFFPLTWHIIKDIPNGLFLSITLENNDNKVVTFSRDTQEIGLPQGLKMLEIFKEYPLGASILDDFNFYEDRQKSLHVTSSHQALYADQVEFDEDEYEMEFDEDDSTMNYLEEGIENLSFSSRHGKHSGPSIF